MCHVSLVVDSSGPKVIHHYPEKQAALALLVTSHYYQSACSGEAQHVLLKRN